MLYYDFIFQLAIHLYFIIVINRIGGVMVGVLASSVLDRGIELRSG